MSKIVSIGTAVPAYRHDQSQIFNFMQRVFALDDVNRRKLKFLYAHSGIKSRYSIIEDYGLPADAWRFYPPTENLEPFPNLERRMDWYRDHAAGLSIEAINSCLAQAGSRKITHLITVSCTGMSAPGLDLEILEQLDLPITINRTSINFMGCYAAMHALKIADAYARSDASANVLIVCTELCTLHFQKETSIDNLTSSMLFADGAAAVLVSGDPHSNGLEIGRFYSSIKLKGKQEMAWQLSSGGFQMTLGGYVPDLIEEDFDNLVRDALDASNLSKEDITHWCIHPGGKKILEAVHKSLALRDGELQHCYDVLNEYGNMSSPTVLFVLDRIAKALDGRGGNKIFSAAFGPGLTMETLILSA